jgi:PAS domain S-box-containing protein
VNHLNDRTGRTPYNIEYRLQLKNGEYRWFIATGATTRDRSGVPLRVAGALRDISEAVRSIEEIQSSMQVLTSTQQAIESLIQGV